MRKISIFAIIILIITSLAIVVKGFDNPIYPIYKNFNYIESEMLNSSRYTQKEEVSSEALDYYYEKMLFKPSEDFLNFYGYQEYSSLEDQYLKVYVEKDSFSFIVYDKVNNHYYSSRPEFQGMDGKLEGNASNRRLINSGIWIEYVSSKKPEQSAIKTASLYTFAEVVFETEDVSPTTPEQPFKIIEGSYKQNNVNVEIKVGTDLLFTIKINKEINFSFDINVSLKEGELSFEVINDSIIEEESDFAVLSLRLLPYFGATREDKVPGYFLIPEGVGALIRLTERREQSFGGRVYGDDIGFNRRYYNNVSVPLFGLIHEVNKTGFYAYVDGGDEHLILNANFYNSSSNYNRISFKFNLREMNRRIIDQAGNGRDSIVDNIVKTNYKINYRFLNDDASYVGIANDYQKVLKNNGLTSKYDKTEITTNITYLMNDVEEALLGNKKVKMTTFNNVLNIYHELNEAGLKNQNTLLLGYAKEGAGASLSTMKLFDSKKALKNLSDEVGKDDNQLYFVQNYVYATNLSKRVKNRDIAKNASRLLLQIREQSLAFQNYYKVIAPNESYQKAVKDSNFLNGYEIGLAEESIGNTLFTYYDKKIYDKSISKDYYEKIAALNKETLLNTPNSYLWDYTNGYLNLSLGNNAYLYYTDLVPFIPILLQGIMPVYSTYLNFNAVGQTKLLTMIDFNIYPHYIITKEDTSKLKYTNSAKYYSTTYSDYKEEIVAVYHYLNEPLKNIINANLIKRDIIEVGIVKNTYSNGVVICINYTSNDVLVDDLLVKALDYRVIL